MYQLSDYYLFLCCFVFCRFLLITEQLIIGCGQKSVFSSFIEGFSAILTRSTRYVGLDLIPTDRQ